MLKSVYNTTAVAAVAAMCVACGTHNSQSASGAWQLAGVERTRILVDSRYDAQPDAEAGAFIEPYKAKVNEQMSPVVGRTARFMASYRPESELSNLLTDILVWAGARFGEKPDFAVYNMGGIRAALPEGDVTVGDVLDTAPFENRIMFLTLTGAKVKELFAQIAARGGEGVSAGVKLRITRDGQLLGAEVGGRPVDDNATYRIATLDYLAQGNDGLVAFKSKTDCKSPDGAENTVRNIIMDYFREAAAKGQAVDSSKDGRITVE